MAQDSKTRSRSEPMDRLKTEAQGLLGALGDRAVSSLRGKVDGATGRMTGYVEGGAGPGLMAAVTGAKKSAEGKGPMRSMLGAGMSAAKEKVTRLFGKGGGKGGKKLKVTNIVESIDVGAPVTLVYNQWTQFADFPSFTKKVENVEQPEEAKVTWKAQVLWSHRTWESTIQEQVPDDKIIWRSKGDKGRVDGAVTFHELAPNLTRVLLVLEYHPQGLFERTGNIWRAQGRRARLELKHFRRHLMSEVLLHPEEVEGWRGVIKDGEVVEDHKPAGGKNGNGGGKDSKGNGGRKAGARGKKDQADDQDREDGAEEPSGSRRSSGRSAGGENGRPVSRTAASRSRQPASRGQRSGGNGRSEGNGRTAERPRRATRRSSTQGEG